MASTQEITGAKTLNHDFGSNIHGFTFGHTSSRLFRDSTKQVIGVRDNNGSGFGIEVDTNGTLKTYTPAGSVTTAYTTTNKPTWNDIQSKPVVIIEGAAAVFKDVTITASNQSTTAYTLDGSNDNGGDVTYDDANGELQLNVKENNVKHTILEAPVTGSFVNVPTELRENNVRVYSDSNKPSPSDIGALPVDGKAKTAIHADSADSANTANHATAADSSNTSTYAVSAGNSAHLGGYEGSAPNIGNTVPVRDGAGDINTRLIRSEYPTDTSINLDAGICMRNAASGDNYMRSVTKDGFRAWNGNRRGYSNSSQKMEGKNYSVHYIKSGTAATNYEMNSAMEIGSTVKVTSFGTNPGDTSFNGHGANYYTIDGIAYPYVVFTGRGVYECTKITYSAYICVRLA